MKRRPTICASVLASLLGCGADDAVPGAEGTGSSPGTPETSGSAESSSSSVDPDTSPTGSTAPGSDTENPSFTSSGGSGSSTDATQGDPLECDFARPPARGGVVTDRGTVVGTIEEGATSFLGLPYAAPPVGERRWQPPIPAECWEDVYVADSAAPDCAQLDSIDGPVVGDEDCLYLNVWTPEGSSDEGRPVMVFIHGGGHALGSGSDPLYDGAHLARTYGVVTVTINYRLGALGYLANENLDARDERGVSGNYGLLDQLLSLQWVSQNIEAFGGDPERVTLFGESAGAVSTCAVLGAPQAEGLIAGAVIQSGGCSQRLSDRYRQEVGDPWVAASTCADDDDVAECLQSLPFAEVVAAEPTGYPSVAALGQTWSAYVDGDTLPSSTLEQIVRGQHVDVPVIVGANAEETAQETPLLDEPAYEALVGLTFGALGDLVLGQYPVDDYTNPSAAWTAITSDVKFICPARRTLAALSSGARSPAYRYHFSYDGYTTGPMGEASAFHGLELVYVFGNFAALTFGGFPYPVNADDQAMATILGTAWTRFAATGDPSVDALNWPSYEPASDPYARLDVPPTIGQGVRGPQCDFWDGFAGR